MDRGKQSEHCGYSSFLQPLTPLAHGWLPPDLEPLCWDALHRHSSGIEASIVSPLVGVAYLSLACQAGADTSTACIAGF